MINGGCIQVGSKLTSFTNGNCIPDKYTAETIDISCYVHERIIVLVVNLWRKSSAIFTAEYIVST